MGSPLNTDVDAGAVTAVARAFLATWRAMLGDKAVLTVMFIAGLLYSVVYPYPYANEAVRGAPVAIVDADQGSMSRQLVRWAQAHPQLHVVAVVPQVQDAQDLLWRQQVVGVLIIPAGLQREVLAGRPGRVEVAGNAAWFLLNKSVLGAFSQVAGTLSAGIEVKRLEAATPSPAQARMQREPVSLRTVPLFNVREGYGSGVVPAVAVLIVQQTALLGIALLMGTWSAAGGQGRPRGAAGFLGAWLAFASVVVINGAWFLGAVLVLQGYPHGGSPGPVLGLLGVYGLTVAAFGMAVGALFRSREGGMQLMLFVSVPMLFLAGSSWPVEALPAPLRVLRWALPSTPGIQGFVALQQLGATGAEVRPMLGAMAALGLASLAVAAWAWRGLGRRGAD